MITVGKIRAAIEGLPDDAKVIVEERYPDGEGECGEVDLDLYAVEAATDALLIGVEVRALEDDDEADWLDDDDDDDDDIDNA